MTGSHLHPFSLNWIGPEARMRAGNLPFAIKIVPDPETFREILDFASDALRISDIDRIVTPNWSRR